MCLSIKECQSCRPSGRQNPYYDSDWDVELYERVLWVDEEALKSLRMAANQFRCTQGARLLFLGCGSGRIEIPLLEGLAWNSVDVEVHIVDVNKTFIERFIERFKEKIRDKNVRLTVHHGPMEEFWEKHSTDAKFDVITAFFVLYLSPQWHEIVFCIISRLNPGGYFLLAEETGDLAGGDLSSEGGSGLLELEKFVKECLGNPCDFHSPRTLGILKESFWRLEKAGFVRLERIDLTWENSNVSYQEYLDVMTGKRKALGSSLYLPVKLRKTFKEKFQCWSQKTDKVKVGGGHRIWVVQLKEAPEKVAGAYLRCHYTIVGQTEYLAMWRSYVAGGSSYAR